METKILKFVNSLGANFDVVKVVPDLDDHREFSEKRSHGDLDSYYYGDQFQLDSEIIARQETVYWRIYNLELRELAEDCAAETKRFFHSPSGRYYPNFSLWVDEFHLLILYFLVYKKNTIVPDIQAASSFFSIFDFL